MLGKTNTVTGFKSLEIDTQMSDSSENAVQNKVIKSYVDTGIANLQEQIDDIDVNSGSGGGSSITVDAEMSDTSENPVQNKVVKAYIDTTEQDIISRYMDSDSDLQLQINRQATVLAEVKDDVMSNMSEIADIKGQLSNIGSITITYLE